MNENKLGKIIVGLRKSKGFTQKKLADELHVSDKSLSNWERGYSIPTIETIYLISKYFEVNFHDLMKARLEDDKDNKLVKGVIDEFNDLGNKKAKRLKKILFVALFLIIILIVGIVFAFNYNKFVVYKVGLENSEFIPINGTYIETNQKDTLYLNNIKVKNLEIKSTDNVSLDVYIQDADNEILINTFSDLNNIHIDNYDSYIEFDNLSKYFDKLYLRLTIIDKNDQVREFNTKLKFVKDFTNSKIYLKEDKEYKYDFNKTPEEIKEIFLQNDFNEKSNNCISKRNQKYTINYIMKTNKVNIIFENNNLNNMYIYNFNTNMLEVIIYNDSNVEIENYKYDLNSNKVIECKIGKCNNYQEALEILNKEVFDLFE